MRSSVKPKAKTKRNAASRGYDIEKNLRQFCESTSHELQNVLGTIIGEMDYALSTNKPQVKERSMQIALHAAESAMRLSHNLNFFALHTRLNFKTVDLAQVILDAVDILEKELELNKVYCKVYVEANTYTELDPSAIQQVLLNLLYNSSQAMPDGGTITLTLTREKKFLEIKCQDTGKAISPADLDKVFDPYFSRGAKSRKQGLGLAVCRALVESHGGEIEVESLGKEGASFQVRLPYDPKVKQPDGFERIRKYRRVSITLPATLTVKNQAPLPARLSVLSLGGCFAHFTCSPPFDLPEPNEDISIEIGYYDNEVIRIEGARVASVFWAGSNPGLGLEFKLMEDKAKRMVVALVQSHPG